MDVENPSMKGVLIVLILLYIGTAIAAAFFVKGVSLLF